MKKIIIPFLLILTLCSCSSLNIGQPVSDIEYPEATINKETVTYSELEYFEKNHRSEVMSEFILKYDAVPDDDFLETPINGETPQQHLYNLCKEKILKAKIQLVLCRENNIYDDISIEYFYELKEQHNKNFENNKTIGINKIPDNYYDYYIDNGVMELKNILSETTLVPTENEIQKKMGYVKNKYPDKSQEEQLSIAKDILVEEKYNAYIEKLCNEAQVNWSSFDNFK